MCIRDRVTGCLAQRYEKDLMQEIPEIDLLMGVNQYQQLPDALEKALGGVRKSYCMDDHTYYAHDRVLTTPSYTAYTRIGEGCSIGRVEYSESLDAWDGTVGESVCTGEGAQ